MTSPSLEAKHVSRAFGALAAVEDVSLTLHGGEIIVLLGPSGSGKSTLLRMLAGLEPLDGGEILASGLLVATPNYATPPEQRGLGMVFQDYALFPHLTALGNVVFGLRGTDKAERRRIGMDWLARVGLADRYDYYPHQLSGGEQQRIALARALAPKPYAVLMDEPFSGLDPHLRSDLQRTMLMALRDSGVAALVVSHDAEEALGIADQIAIMDHGRLIQVGAPNEVYDAPVTLQAARALGPVWTFRSQSRDGVAETALGPVKTKFDGAVTLGVRPEATSLHVDPLGQFTVTQVRGVGRFVTVTVESAQCVAQARIEVKNAPAKGQKVRITVESDDIFVFNQ